MKFNRLPYYLYILIFTGLLISCEKIEIPRLDEQGNYDKVYIPAASKNPNIVTLNMADKEYTLTYGAYFGGYGKPEKDIQLSFEINPDSVAAFNRSNGTNYELLPAQSYQLHQPLSVIKAGSLSTDPLSVTINPSKGLVLFKEYLLPVSIKTVSDGVKINEKLRTAYYVVKSSLNLDDFKDFDRSNWSIASVSSEEPNEGAINGGLGKHVLDGLNSTFWHTKWAGGYAPPPHFIVVDMGKSLSLHGLSFVGRQNNNTGKPSTVKVELSENGVDKWKDAGTLKLQDILTVQRLFLANTFEGRYLRITILTNFGNEPFTHLAELGAF